MVVLLIMVLFQPGKTESKVAETQKAEQNQAQPKSKPKTEETRPGQNERYSSGKGTAVVVCKADLNAAKAQLLARKNKIRAEARGEQ
jgi:hypothetical protein